MLLKAKTVTLNGKTALRCTKVGGETQDVNAPFPPYYYSPRRLSFGNQLPERKIMLSTMTEKDVFKTEFMNTRVLSEFRTPDSIQSRIPYDQRCAIDLNGGLHVASGVPTHLSFDMEMESRSGFFPNALHDKCTALSVADKVANWSKCKTINDVPEYEILSWFFDEVKRRNPDILGSFFGSYADFPWLIQRCKVNNIPVNLGRIWPYTPWVQERVFKSGKKIGKDVIIDLPGRVHLDVYKEVAMDQSLFGIKNHQLKTTARWFGIPVIQVDRAKMDSLSPDELRDYCESDAKATDELLHIYLRNLIPLAERLKIPFSMVVERSPSHISNYIYMRAFKDLNVLADANNNMRYPQFAKHINQEGSSYQGALISLFRAGLYDEESIEELIGVKAKLGHIDANCVSADTECLTREGWKTYDVLKSGEEILTFNKDKLKFEYQLPDVINVYPFKGELFNLKTQCVDFLCTDKHRVLYRNKRTLNGNLQVTYAENLKTYITIPVSAEYDSVESDVSDDKLRLLAWVITEGSIQQDLKRITISQAVKHVEFCNDVESALIGCQFGFVAENRMHKKSFMREFRLDAESSQRLCLEFGLSSHKLIPNVIFESSIRQRRLFLSELIKGDGVANSESNVSYSSNDLALANQVQILAVTSGYSAYIHECKHSKTNQTEYWVRISKRTEAFIRNRKLNKTFYDGVVWCPTVKNTFFLARRNGKPFITGNSMYPTNMICFNYSPETIFDLEIERSKLIGDDDSQSPIWLESVKFNGNQICVYDKFLGWIKVKVKQDFDGISRVKLQEFFDERLELKKLIAERKRNGESFDDLESSQWGVKVCMNSIPGYNGMGYALCGSFPIAAQICGLGRWEISHSIDYVKRKGWIPIEADTDGLYYAGLPCAKEVTDYIRSLIPDRYRKEVIKFGFDEYDAGIFYAQKGYILFDKSKPFEKQIIYHGSGLKGRHLPRLCDRALDKVVRAIFAKEDISAVLKEIKKDLYSDSNMEDFLLTVKLSKNPNNYAESNMYGKLIQKARFAGMNVTWGSEFQIIATTNGLEPYGAVYGKPFIIDMNYYMERIASVVSRPLTVTHGYSEQQVLLMLKGYDLPKSKMYKQVKLRRSPCNRLFVDWKNLMIPLVTED